MPRAAAGQRRGLSTAPAQYTAFFFFKGIVSEWKRQGTSHPPFTPSDVCIKPNQLISVRKHKAPVAVLDVVPQTLLFKVKSSFSSSSSPASGPLSTRNAPPDLHLAKEANRSPDRGGSPSNSQSPPQTSQSCFSSSFPSPLVCSRSHPLAFGPLPAGKSCSRLIFIEAATRD